uniref:Zinc transporter ZIP6 n=1 Tax=Cyprinus carpio TaxID=7962 RepID=A0A8C1JT08_CYPCA
FFFTILDTSMIGRWPRLFSVMSLTLLGACSVGAGTDCKSMAIETDVQVAEQAQQRHLQALFDKYGHNGSISLEGLFNLLKRVGLDRIRKVTVHHHGNGHNHTHVHDHTHAHVDKLTTHSHPSTSKKGGIDRNVEKSDPIPKVQPDPASVKKSQSDAHHNLYMKMNQDLTTTLTTPSYVTKSRRTNRSADYDLTQDHASFNSTQSNNHTHQTEDTPTHCQNASTILQSHGMTKEMVLSVKDFSYLCPALLMQIDSNSCLLHDDDHSGDRICITVYFFPDHSHHHNHHHHHHHLHNHTNGRSPRNASIIIGKYVLLNSAPVVQVVEHFKNICFLIENCFCFLLDFKMYFIPSQGHHQHGHSEHHHHGEEVEEDSLRPVWTGLTALSGVYIMFLIEHFLTLGKMYKDKKQKVQKRVDFVTEVLESEKLPSLEDNDVKTIEGAAFTEGLSSGLSTSVAVFCHELPHELGDFAVLLKAGMSVRQAILYNLLSALMGYFGMITGILIGHYAENVATWIFALTAGLFMYVALVDMVPEMLHNDASEAGFSHYGFFLLQNAGILLGFGIMLIIAVFEQKIQLDIGF